TLGDRVSPGRDLEEEQLLLDVGREQDEVEQLGEPRLGHLEGPRHLPPRRPARAREHAGQRVGDGDHTRDAQEARLRRGRWSLDVLQRAARAAYGVEVHAASVSSENLRSQAWAASLTSTPSRSAATSRWRLSG